MGPKESNAVSGRRLLVLRYMYQSGALKCVALASTRCNGLLKGERYGVC